MSGTVCDTMTYGSRPRSTTRNRAITIASAMPKTAPSTSPTSAMRNVYQLYPTIASQIGVSFPRTSGSNSRLTISQVCGIA